MLELAMLDLREKTKNEGPWVEAHNELGRKFFLPLSNLRFLSLSPSLSRGRSLSKSKPSRPQSDALRRRRSAKEKPWKTQQLVCFFFGEKKLFDFDSSISAAGRRRSH